MSGSGDYTVPIPHRLHAGYGHETLRGWQGEGAGDRGRLIYPLFIAADPDARQEIGALPGQARWGVNRLEEALAGSVEQGLAAVLLFGAGDGPKDARGTGADAPENAVLQALPRLGALFPGLLLATDVCLCAYTDHGHCGLFGRDGRLDNAAGVARLAEVAAAHARCGAHMVAPSDMMDGRVGAIKAALRAAGREATAVMSYAAKLASCFYGPFREAARSAPAFGDRRAYQLPPAARRLALRAVDRDVAEGADLVMVKPAGPCLDLVRETRDRVDVPVVCYQVSGEYAMLHHAAAAGAFDLRAAVLETLAGFRRAGADAVITYFAPRLLGWL